MLSAQTYGCLMAAFLSLADFGCAHQNSSVQLAEMSSKYEIILDSNIKTAVPFISRYFGEGDWNSALAMNISYKPIKDVRSEIEKLIYGGQALRFLTDWEPNGEAHITTITPVEYQQCMWSRSRGLNVLDIETINTLARKMNIQSSDLSIEGLGVARKKFENRDSTVDQTHFLIVRSQRLQEIRNEIYRRYLANGGVKDCWSPEIFFPHITIGYTYKDIHFPDVQKNLEKSIDERFKLTH